MQVSDKLGQYAALVDSAMNARLPAGGLPQGRVAEAMAYSLSAGGKRLRPALVFEFCRVCGGDIKDALPQACAVEMVHTYSLIHDDLPCMDDDDYRRGKPTNHKVFGEAMAVLAGDALLTAAFEVIASGCAEGEVAAASVLELAKAAGVMGMLGGQVLDLEGETRPYSEEEIRLTHSLKTGALIAAACKLGCIAAGGSARQTLAAERYGKAVGYAFQLRDDLLDVLGDPKVLGKATGHDENKQTIVALRGIEYCEELITAETEKAKAALEDMFADTGFLNGLADYLAGREK